MTLIITPCYDKKTFVPNHVYASLCISLAKCSALLLICVIANTIFPQFSNENHRHQHYFVDNIGRKLKALREISSYYQGLCC